MKLDIHKLASGPYLFKIHFESEEFGNFYAIGPTVTGNNRLDVLSKPCANDFFNQVLNMIRSGAIKLPDHLQKYIDDCTINYERASIVSGDTTIGNFMTPIVRIVREREINLLAGQYEALFDEKSKTWEIYHRKYCGKELVSRIHDTENINEILDPMLHHLYQ